MSILMPLAIPLAWAVSSGDLNFTIVCTSGVLTGAIFGDHCSPISDTTILSSSGASCNHMDPCSNPNLLCNFCSRYKCLFRPYSYRIRNSMYICIPLDIIIMFIGLRLIGEKVDFEEVKENKT